MFLLGSVDNVNKLWLKTGSPNEKAVDVGAGGQLLRVGSSDRATILNAHRGSNVS